MAAENPMATRAAKQRASKKTAKASKAKKKVAKKAAKKPAKKAPKKVAKKAKAPAGKAKPARATKAAKPKPAASRTKAVKKATRAASKTAKKKPTKKKKARRPTVAQSRRQWKRFRTILLGKQRELTQAYNISKDDSRSKLDDGTEDYIDYAVSSYAREFLLSLTELDRKQLLLVEEGLKRIDRGDYGTCLNCHETIPEKRLEVAPWARHCLRCQELEEQGLLEERPLIGDADDIDDDLDDEEFDEEEELEAAEPDSDDDEEESSDDDLTITEGED
jgi:DnaK suppressor protein